MGKQKNGKKGRREIKHLPALTRYGKSKAEEEKVLLQLKQEGILYLDDFRVGASGFSYNITNEDRPRRSTRSQIPERVKAFMCTTKNRSLLSKNPVIFPDPKDYSLGLEHLSRFYQRQKRSFPDSELSDKEWLQLRRTETGMMREENKERATKDKKAKETAKLPSIVVPFKL